MPNSTLDLHVQGQPFQANNAVLAQVGWIGHANGAVYGLDATPSATEPGGYRPLYIQVGTYVSDVDGNRMWED